MSSDKTVALSDVSMAQSWLAAAAAAVVVVVVVASSGFHVAMTLRCDASTQCRRQRASLT